MNGDFSEGLSKLHSTSPKVLFLRFKSKVNTFTSLWQITREKNLRTEGIVFFWYCILWRKITIVINTACTAALTCTNNDASKPVRLRGAIGKAKTSGVTYPRFWFATKLRFFSKNGKFLRNKYNDRMKKRRCRPCYNWFDQLISVTKIWSSVSQHLQDYQTSNQLPLWRTNTGFWALRQNKKIEGFFEPLNSWRAKIKKEIVLVSSKNFRILTDGVKGAMNLIWLINFLKITSLTHGRGRKIRKTERTSSAL